MELTNNRKNFIFYGSVFAGVVVIDLIVFLLTREVVVVNWAHPVHYGWVLSALIIFWAVTIINKKYFSRAALLIYLTIFTLSFLNQYLNFSFILTSYCMLFNAVLASAYLFKE
jgi:hypothetical protein